MTAEGRGSMVREMSAPAHRDNVSSPGGENDHGAFQGLKYIFRIIDLSPARRGDRDKAGEMSGARP